MVTKDKVRAIMLAIAAGDALGKTVEMFSAGEIKKRFGRITTYLSPPDDHKWAAGWPANRWTDDTSMSLAVLNALTEAGGFDMDAMVRHHIIEYDKNPGAFGPKTSTARAILALKTGKPWSETGSPKGKGNGVAMKIAPLGIFLALQWERFHGEARSMYWRYLNYYAKELANMTHANNMGEVSGIVQTFAVAQCLRDNFSSEYFAQSIYNVSVEFENKTDEHPLSEFLGYIENSTNLLARCPIEVLLEPPWLFGNGSCYIPDSLPWTYSFFVRNPYSIETLFDVVNAGGDTDTNGAMCGALLGAANGMGLFENHEYLIEELWRKDELIAAADAFCDKFKIE